MAGLYIHIPFCRSRCVYCGFYSTTSLSRRQNYVEALCREMQLRAHEGGHRQETVSTVYLGGGTPSQLSVVQLRQLFDAIYHIYNVEADAEVTMECNPDDVTTELAAGLAQLPVNRVSMGGQTFSDQRLRFIGRRHSAAQVTQAVERLRLAGIGNVSVDLMYGFPGETLEAWLQDVEAALALKVEHLSAYALTYEEGTPLWRMLEQGRVEETDEELSRQMYYELKDRLETAGYEHYEISNFARPGFRSRHNSSYWNHTPYIGLGAGAHSFDGSHRCWNVADLDAYLKAVSEEGRVPAEGEVLDEDTLYNELIMTRLRTREGIDLNGLQEHYRKLCLRQAVPYVASGLLHQEGHSLRLSREGLFVSDMVMSDLMV